MWENITRQEKGGIVSHEATCYIFYESEIQDIEAELASAGRRIDAARADGAPLRSRAQAEVDPASQNPALDRWRLAASCRRAVGLGLLGHVGYSPLPPRYLVPSHSLEN